MNLSHALSPEPAGSGTTADDGECSIEFDTCFSLPSLGESKPFIDAIFAIFWGSCFLGQLFAGAVVCWGSCLLGQLFSGA
ncbi:MAG: hypothetical protein P1U77_13510, partial [Rubripirellula sp.]|nr:hypothetical protein [Rubripirellula sp.]